MRRSTEIDACVVAEVNVASDRSTMASSGGASSKGLAGKKRKAPGDVLAIREPRRGLGVAELETIRALLETADGFYLAPSLSTPPAVAAATAAPPPPLPSLVGQVPGVRYDRYVCPVQCNHIHI